MVYDRAREQALETLAGLGADPPPARDGGLGADAQSEVELCLSNSTSADSTTTSDAFDFDIDFDAPRCQILQ